jgi:hypothetical protein
VFGLPNWALRAEHSESAEIVSKAIFNLTALIEPALIAGNDFRPFRKMVDIGGGRHPAGVHPAEEHRRQRSRWIFRMSSSWRGMTRERRPWESRCELVEGGLLPARAFRRRRLHSEVDRPRLE